MPKLKIEQLREGMIVEVDVRNMDDMLLLPAGCELAEKHIGILEAWGVTDVQVKVQDEIADGSDPLAKLPPEEVARLTQKTKEIFWQLDENVPIQMHVFNLVLRRAARRSLATNSKS